MLFDVGHPPGTYIGKICVRLSLQTGDDGAPTLVIPWSGENLAFVDEVQSGETSRPRKDKVLACAKRKGLSRLEVFSTRVSDFEVRSWVCLPTLAFNV